MQHEVFHLILQFDCFSLSTGMVTTFTFLFDFSNFRVTFSDFVDGQQNNTPRLILIKYQYPVHSALHCTVLSCISLYFIVINTAHCTSTENPTMHCKLPFAILFDVNEHTKQNTGGQLPPHSFVQVMTTIVMMMFAWAVA